MTRYQFRVPENTTLEDVISDMTVKAWLMINNNFEFAKIPQDYYQAFKERVRSPARKHIAAYDLCGCFDVCELGIESRPWSADPRLDVHPQDHIYHLILENDLDEFLALLSLQSLQVIKPVLKPNTETKVLSTLQMVFKCVLGDYLYFNPLCGESEPCRSSEQIPLLN